MVMRAMVAAFATGEIDGLEAFVDVSYLDHQGLPHIRPIEGVDGFRHVARSGYVELSVEIADLIERTDRCAARLIWRGVRPSGENVERQTLEFIRVESGRAVEHWGGHS